MPRDLAADPEATVFDYRGIISPPRDCDRWAALVRGLVAPPRRALRPRRGRALGRSRSGTSRTSGVLVGRRNRSTSRCTRSRARAVKARRPALPGRRPVDRGGRLGRRPARARRARRRPARLHHDPHLRDAAARPAADHRAVRPRRPAAAGGPSGASSPTHGAPVNDSVVGRAARRRAACGRRPAGSTRCRTGSPPTISWSSASPRRCSTAGSGC